MNGTLFGGPLDGLEIDIGEPPVPMMVKSEAGDLYVRLMNQTKYLFYKPGPR